MKVRSKNNIVYNRYRDGERKWYTSHKDLVLTRSQVWYMSHKREYRAYACKSRAKHKVRKTYAGALKVFGSLTTQGGLDIK